MDEKHGTDSRDHEYKRLGTLSLLAGIDLQTGDAIPLVSETHNSKDYIHFLQILDDRYSKGDRIYKYFEEVNEEPVVFHWKYNLDDIDIAESVKVDMLPIKKSS